MGRIVAIGGGELRRRETLPIDRYIVSLCGLPRPRLLFIPTASGDAPGYIDLVKEVYSGLGCELDALCLCGGGLTAAECRQKILGADIIYVGGGNTEAMMKLWSDHSVDRWLREAYRAGTVLAGLSAGSICWFSAGYSDSEFIAGGDRPAMKWVKGLGLLPFLHSPHYDEAGRRDFDAFFAGQAVDAIALENNTAFVELDGRCFIVKADPAKKAYRLSWDGASVRKDELCEGVRIQF